MSSMDTELENGELYAKASTGNKQWVAVITDTHPKYNYERDFVAYQKPKTSDRASGRVQVEDGDVIEKVRCTHSGKNDSRWYYQVVGDEMHEIEEQDVTQALDEVIVDVGPGQEVVDELATIDGVGSTLATRLAEAGYESVEDVEDAYPEDLTDIKGLGEATAESITAADEPTDQTDGGTAETSQTVVADGGAKYQCRHCDWTGTTMDEAEDHADRYRHDVHIASTEPDRSEPSDDDDGGDPDVVTDGGLDVRDYQDVRHSDDLVREYKTPPGEVLYAYRSDDDEHHIVVSRGDEPADQWERRVPAEVERPVPGQKLWAIPDNWDQRVLSRRENIAYGLFEIPEADLWVKTSIPTNNWLTDAWYGVKAVGTIEAKPVGDLGSYDDVRELANDYEEAGRDDDAAALRAVARNWHHIEDDLKHALEWVADEGVDQQQPGDQPLTLTGDWELEFQQDRIFKPTEAIKHSVDLSEFDIDASTIADELRRADLLPSYYSFELSLDDSDVPMEYYIRGLEDAGCSAAEALDYYFVEIKDQTQTERAERRGKDQSTISGNANSAKRVIGE